MEIFTLELPAPYTLEFLKTGYEWVLDVNISSRTAHPDLVSKPSAFILTMSDFLLETELIYLSCTAVCATKQPGWPFHWEYAHLLQCNVPVSLK